MPVNSINSLSGVNKVNSVSFKANDAEKKEQKTEANLAEKLHSSKLPYVAGGLVLAGLGVFLGNKYLKGVKNEPHIQREIFEIESKVKDKVDEAVNTVAAEIKKVVKKEEQVIEEIVPTTEVKNNGILNIIQSLKSNALKKEEAMKPIIEFNEAHQPEVTRIIWENNHGGEVDINILEKVGRDFADDKNRPDNIKQAANMFEKAYRKVYYETRPNDTSCGLEKVLNRITVESDDLFKVYAQLPKEEVVNRVAVWARDMNTAGFRPVGMNYIEFEKKLLEALASRKIV